MGPTGDEQTPSAGGDGDPTLVVLRPMQASDVSAVVDIQEPGAVRSLGEIFPQDRYPFPREEVARRWRQEIETPGIDSFVVLLGAEIVGFAAVRADELLHFGVAVEHWGTGLAESAHDQLLDLMAERGVDRPWLRVFTLNRRARRFYERLGWRPTGVRSESTFPPHPELMHYDRERR